MRRHKKGVGSYEQNQELDLKGRATPEELVGLLFDKACMLLQKALSALDEADGESFHQASLHALQIVLSLRFVLDTEHGGTLSESLSQTYTAIAASLRKAKEEEDIKSISTIYDALNELRVAWHAVS
jgi:flagellar biosynthetic protein FliS